MGELAFRHPPGAVSLGRPRARPARDEAGRVAAAANPPAALAPARRSPTLRPTAPGRHAPTVGTGGGSRVPTGRVTGPHHPPLARSLERRPARLGTAVRDRRGPRSAH